jgi:hypothetical protein
VRPAARNMARAPARLKPSVKALLRCFSEVSDTPESLRRVQIAMQKKKAITSLSDGPELSKIALPARHHPLASAPTIVAGQIRTTTGIAEPASDAGATKRVAREATGNMSIALKVKE